MRLNCYLTEKKDKDYVSEIKKKCSEILKYLNRNVLLYRGTNKEIEDVEYFIPRKDRKPFDTDLKVHRAFDAFLWGKFKWMPRSEGVFASGSQRHSYGRVYYFFPVNGFKFVWSPIIFDLFTETKGIDLKSKGGQVVFNKLVNSYKDNDLKEAILSEKEISFKCDGYYMVDFKSKIIDGILK